MLETNMTKAFVAIAVLALSMSGAFAAHHRTHHHAVPSADASPSMAPMMWPGASNTDHADHMKNLHESGYNPKDDFNSNGTIKAQ